MKCVILLILLAACCTAAQTGGTYSITESVIAAGGTQAASGGGYVMQGTIGQSAAGMQSSGGQFSVRGGFWSEAFAPTAANVSLSGTISLDDDGMRRVRILVQNLSTGVVRSTTPNQFGSYSFDDLDIGLYLIRIESDVFQFAPNDVVITMMENTEGVNFTGTRIF